MRLDALLDTLKKDMKNSTADYEDQITSELESQFTREFYMKKLNKAMSEGEEAEFTEYIAAMSGIGSAEKIAELADRFNQ